jgi:hypothetical protein
MNEAFLLEDGETLSPGMEDALEAPGAHAEHDRAALFTPLTFAAPNDSFRPVASSTSSSGDRELMSPIVAGAELRENHFSPLPLAAAAPAAPRVHTPVLTEKERVRQRLLRQSRGFW